MYLRNIIINNRINYIKEYFKLNKSIVRYVQSNTSNVHKLGNFSNIKSRNNKNSVLTNYSIKEATENDINKFFTLSKDEIEKYVPEGLNKNTNQHIEYLPETHFMLREPTYHMMSYLKNWENINLSNKKNKFLIRGERGTGKTISLLQIVHYARANNWIVLYIPRGRSWCYESHYIDPSNAFPNKYDNIEYGKDLLKQILHCHGEQLEKLRLKGKYANRYCPRKFEMRPIEYDKSHSENLTLRDLVENGIHSTSLSCTAIADLRKELSYVTEYPILIAVDEYDSWLKDTIFGYDEKPVGTFDLTVIDALSDIRPLNDHFDLTVVSKKIRSLCLHSDQSILSDKKEREMKNGLFIGACTENYPSKYNIFYQLSKDHSFINMKPYNSLEMDHIIKYYNETGFLQENLTDQEIAYIRLLTKSIPLKVLLNTCLNQ